MTSITTSALAALAAAGLMTISSAWATQSEEPAILIIGASYANGATPFNDSSSAPLGGMAVNFGRYLSVGNAIVRDPRLAGFVFNEAEAGATTFDRPACTGNRCGPMGWHGYDTQLKRAMARVSERREDGGIRYHADHVIISMANDCLHADAMGVPQSQAKPCSTSELDAVIGRLISVGRTASTHGIAPVFEVYPAWSDLDLALTKRLFQLTWTIDESSYTYLRDQHRTRIPNELPGSLVVNPWRNFQHIGDGLHPSPTTANTAGSLLVKAINSHRRAP